MIAFLMSALASPRNSSKSDDLEADVRPVVYYQLHDV
jgi:hypothetical protein